MKKILFVSLLVSIIVLSQHCAPEKKISVTPQQMAKFNLAIMQADDYYQSGSYLSLKKAFEVYEHFVNFPALRHKTRIKFLKTALLLSLRQFELSIINHSYLKKAKNLVEVDPALSKFDFYIESVKFMSGYSGGNSNSYEKYDREDDQLDHFFDWVKDNAALLNEKLQKSAPYDEFFAYLYIAVNENFPYWIKNKQDVLPLKKIFAGSPLVQFKLSIFPKIDQSGLKNVISSATDFYEVYGFLGQSELLRGKTLTSEKNFLHMYDHIPNSIWNMLSLTKVYFILEEYDKCLEFNEKILKFSPSHRNALLGKAICLSFLGKHKEAISVCNTILQLGKYNIGESYYWLAWNEKELNKLYSAWKNAQTSKKYLVGHHELLFLSGIIAYKMEDFRQAEKEFKEALKMNPGYCEASYYLGSIYAKRDNWKTSGDHFQSSAQCSQRQETAIKNKIQEIENSSFAEERKQKHLKKKKLQLVSIRMSKATASYNAAASYFNAKMYTQALPLAQEAAKHPNFKKQAEELIVSIKHLMQRVRGFK
jgi:tetratricopeptide (TPR) repeat protein